MLGIFPLFLWTFPLVLILFLSWPILSNPKCVIIMWIKVTYNDGSTGSRDYCAPSDGGENWIDQWLFYFIPEFPNSNFQFTPNSNLLIHNRRVWTVVWENLNLDSLFFCRSSDNPGHQRMNRDRTWTLSKMMFGFDKFCHYKSNYNCGVYLGDSVILQLYTGFTLTVFIGALSEMHRFWHMAII